MKTLNELHQWMEDNEYFDLANVLAVTRYKAMMWDKYQKEARIHKDLVQALEITEIVDDVREIFEENRSELTELQEQAAQGAERYPNAEPHAHDNFGKMGFYDPESQAIEFEPTKDASGQIYTGYDDEDLPGEARKGEN